MKFISRLTVALLLSASLAQGQGGTLSLEPNETVLVEPGNNVLEHALNEYHHYYPKSADIKVFDFNIVPFYKHLNVHDSERNVKTFGAFSQAQLNLGDFWIRANTIFGKVKEDINDKKEESKDKKDGETDAAKKDEKKSETKDRSDFGIDDILIKAGYDFFSNGDDHFGVYGLVGIPTNRDLKAELRDKVLTLDAPQLGTKHYRIGGGVNGAYTLYACDDHHLALMFDAQYRFAFSTNYAVLADKKELHFTPGHTINTWSALHYGCDAWNIELGSAFTTTFGKSLSVHDGEESNAKEESKSVKNEDLLKDIVTPKTIHLGVTPYVGFSYNSTICDTPVTLGCGVGYDLNKVNRDDEKKSGSFQGFLGWATASISF